MYAPFAAFCFFFFAQFSACSTFHTRIIENETHKQRRFNSWVRTAKTKKYTLDSTCMHNNGNECNERYLLLSHRCTSVQTRSEGTCANLFPFSPRECKQRATYKSLPSNQLLLFSMCAPDTLIRLSLLSDGSLMQSNMSSLT